MTTEKKKQYLLSYRLQQAKIGRINQMLRAFPDENARYHKQLLEARQRRNKIEGEIAALDDEVLCEVLSQKYLCGRTTEEIAATLNYSTRQIERLHLKALQKINIL